MNRKSDSTLGSARLQFFLRIVGSVDLCAAIVVFLPSHVLGIGQAWTLGVDSIPTGLTAYLARITSAVCAAHGAVLWFMATDVLRYSPLIRFWGGITMLHGLVLIGIGIAEGMPGWWVAMEGPILLLIGLIMAWWSQGILRETSPTELSE